MNAPKENLKEIKENLKDKATDEEALIRAADEGMAGGKPSDLQEIEERIERVEELKKEVSNKQNKDLKRALEKAEFKTAKQHSAAALGEI